MVPGGQAVHTPLDTYWFEAHAAPSQIEFAPDASSPAVFVAPESHGTHALPCTRSLAPHSVAAHLVSSPDASWLPAALVVPGAQSTHAWFTTFLPAEHKVAAHAVFAPEASSFAALVVPGAQALHTFDSTC